MQQTCHLDAQQRREKHVTSWIPAVDSAQSRCTVHYHTCASHLGGTFTVISIGADAVFPGPTAHLEASWKKPVSPGCQSHLLHGSSAAPCLGRACYAWPLCCICNWTSERASAPKRNTQAHVQVPRTKNVQLKANLQPLWPTAVGEQTFPQSSTQRSFFWLDGSDFLPSLCCCGLPVWPKTPGQPEVDEEIGDLRTL